VDLFCIFQIFVWYLTSLQDAKKLLCADQFVTSTSPRAFDCALCPKRGEFERCLRRVGNLSRIYLLLWRKTPVSLFRFLPGLTELQDRILPLLVNNSFKRIFKRSVRVSSWHVSLWKMWTMFDWRQNLSLMRGISVLIGGAFEQLFCPEGREFEWSNLQMFKCLGGGGGKNFNLSSQPCKKGRKV